MIAGWDRFRTVRALCPHGLVDAIATPIAPSREKATSRASQRQFFIRLGLFLIALVLALLALLESRTSWGEAHIFAYIARHMTFHLVRTAGNPVVPTVTGPYDMRLGYAQLPSTLAHLKRFGFRVVAHAESSGLAQEAVKQSHANGATNVGVCIVDYAGRVLVLLRDDNATEHTVLGAEQKAWTAANYHDSTRRLLDRIKKADGDDDQLVYNAKSLFLWGGVPIMDGKDMVGAIGICGNPTGYMDDAVATAASVTLANLLKESPPPK